MFLYPKKRQLKNYPHLPAHITYLTHLYPANPPHFQKHYVTFKINTTTKIKFKRKGSWIRTFKCAPAPVLLRFGYGHQVWLLNFRHTKHRHKRYLTHHCLIWATATHVSLPLPQRLVATRPMNIYSRRGIRFGRFVLKKRKGKESKYTALKSKIF